MPKFEFSPTKGLVQSKGSGFITTPTTTQTLSGNDAVLAVNGPVIKIDAGGSARIDAVMPTGSDGQRVLIMNVGGESIDFDNVVADSGISGSDVRDRLNAAATIDLVYDLTNTQWIVFNYTTLGAV